MRQSLYKLYWSFFSFLDPLNIFYILCFDPIILRLSARRPNINLYRKSYYFYLFIFCFWLLLISCAHCEHKLSNFVLEIIIHIMVEHGFHFCFGRYYLLYIVITILWIWVRNYKLLFFFGSTSYLLHIVNINCINFRFHNFEDIGKKTKHKFVS